MPRVAHIDLGDFEHLVLLAILRLGPDAYGWTGCNGRAVALSIALGDELSKALQGVPERDLALPFMRELVDRVDLTCHLAVLGHHEAVHLEKIVARRYFNQDKTRSVGERVPLHASSVGKALLAWQNPPVLAAYFPGNGLRKSSPRTITNRANLLLKLEEVRKQG